MNSPAKAPIRVLVVDDEPHLVLTVRMHQPLQGYTVFGAHSREEALEAVRQNLADVVILDVTKPGLDGFGTLEELRRFSKTGASSSPTPATRTKGCVACRWALTTTPPSRSPSASCGLGSRGACAGSEQQFWPAATAIAPPRSLPQGGRVRA